MRPAAVVTGGSSGIGADACRRPIERGWHVIGLARIAKPERRAREWPGLNRFTRAYKDETYRTPQKVARAIWELSRRKPRSINGQTFMVGAA